MVSYATRRLIGRRGPSVMVKKYPAWHAPARSMQEMHGPAPLRYYDSKTFARSIHAEIPEDPTMPSQIDESDYGLGDVGVDAVGTLREVGASLAQANPQIQAAVAAVDASQGLPIIGPIASKVKGFVGKITGMFGDRGGDRAAHLAAEAERNRQVDAQLMERAVVLMAEGLTRMQAMLEMERETPESNLAARDLAVQAAYSVYNQTRRELIADMMSKGLRPGEILSHLEQTPTMFIGTFEFPRLNIFAAFREHGLPYTLDEMESVADDGTPTAYAFAEFMRGRYDAEPVIPTSTGPIQTSMNEIGRTQIHNYSMNWAALNYNMVAGTIRFALSSEVRMGAWQGAPLAQVEQYIVTRSPWPDSRVAPGSPMFPFGNIAAVYAAAQATPVPLPPPAPAPAPVPAPAPTAPTVEPSAYQPPGIPTRQIPPAPTRMGGGALLTLAVIGLAVVATVRKRK